MSFRIRRAVPLLTLLAVLVGAGGASASASGAAFQPRIGRAMGIEPASGALGIEPESGALAIGPEIGALGTEPATAQSIDVVAGENIPVVYHGGRTMDTGRVTVHTIFWAPSGYAFSGPPASGALGYVPLVQQFFTDVAHDSGSHSNIFSMLDQYGDSSAPGRYEIAYSARTDSIDDTDPYPAANAQCPSPGGIGTCVTDQDVAAEIDHVIATHDPSGYGLHDVWEVFLPPDVDECSGVDVCGTNAFAGYHSLADVGHGTFIYAVIIDTLIEEPPIAGADPQGNAVAESTIDTSAHETMEAITNPEGNGWMDPNGYEVADKCESGPQVGTPLGYAPDGSPYDQVINGHEYEIQEIWSDATKGCEQSSTVTTDGLPLPVVSLRQYSPYVSGSIESPKAGVAVRVALIRADVFVAEAATVTRANGSWGPIALLGPHGARHGLGDDRDEVIVEYGNGGPAPDLIATGAGGDPFTEAGYTDWLDLDSGFALEPSALAVAPCGQIGVLTVTVDGFRATPPVPDCQTELDASIVRLPDIRAGSQVLLTSEDNRAVTEDAPAGALVRMTIELGEPYSVSSLANENIPFSSSGVPTCTAQLRLGQVGCTGLVPGGRYTLERRRGALTVHGRADGEGVIVISRIAGRPALEGGDVLTLRNSALRVLTTLHVAHLQVAINGNQTVLTSGTCQPGDYWGAPMTSEPSSSSVGEPGAAGLGTICPASGKAAGLSDGAIAQTDDLSGGLTETSVPTLAGEAPLNDATVYGRFTALAQTAVPGPNGSTVATGATVALTITPVGSKTSVWSAANVARAHGVAVKALPAGVYDATWVVLDDNGDTRTVKTTFVEAR